MEYNSATHHSRGEVAAGDGVGTSVSKARQPSGPDGAVERPSSAARLLGHVGAPAAAPRAAGAPELSVVLPLYDEAARLPDTLARLGAHLEATARSFELIAVDDGSRDATPQLLAAAAAHDPRLRLLRHARNRGKGAAVRTGALAARGRHVVFLDADLSTDLEALERLLAELEAGADVVFGSRRAPAARIDARQGRARELAGSVFSHLARRVAHPDVDDFTCGFKGFRAAAARTLFAEARIDRWAFDAELAALSRAHALRLVSLPVRWSQRGGSKVRVLRAALGALRDLARIALTVRAPR